MRKFTSINELLDFVIKVFIRENLSVINNLMQRNNVAFELQGRVRKYLEYISHQESNPEKEAEILNKLTNTLRKEVVLAVNAKHLFTLPFFSQNFSAETLEELSHCLRKVRFSPEEFIYQVIFLIILTILFFY
jgi:predicted transcriptional regulator